MTPWAVSSYLRDVRCIADIIIDNWDINFVMILVISRH